MLGIESVRKRTRRDEDAEQKCAECAKRSFQKAAQFIAELVGGSLIGDAEDGLHGQAFCEARMDLVKMERSSLAAAPLNRWFNLPARRRRAAAAAFAAGLLALFAAALLGLFRLLRGFALTATAHDCGQTCDTCVSELSDALSHGFICFVFCSYLACVPL